MFDRFPRSLTTAKTTNDTERTHLSEPIPSTNPLTRTTPTPTPTPSENMTQQVLRLAEKINDQYLTCKICLVCITNKTLLFISHFSIILGTIQRSKMFNLFTHILRTMYRKSCLSTTVNPCCYLQSILLRNLIVDDECRPLFVSRSINQTTRPFFSHTSNCYQSIRRRNYQWIFEQDRSLSLLENSWHHPADIAIWLMEIIKDNVYLSYVNNPWRKNSSQPYDLEGCSLI